MHDLRNSNSRHPHHRHHQQQQQQQHHQQQLQQHLQYKQSSTDDIDDIEDNYMDDDTNYVSDDLHYSSGTNLHNNSSSHHHSTRAHTNLQSVDSNPMESQSEWSDDDCRDEVAGMRKENFAIFMFNNMNNYFISGGAESTGYITDEPGLENISLLNEAGLTDAEGALSDVNSIDYNAPDIDDTSISSRASSRLLSLDSLSGLYDCELDSKHEMAIVNASHKITSKFGPQV